MPETHVTEGIHDERHRDGSLRARGPVVDGRPHGYLEWFRLDGTRLHSGTFEHGRQVGEWTTYDRTGAPYRTTTVR
ncbi:hypothetical protein SAMN05660209_03885 [Geodermatophilus africanus]|uniref:MORN repeat variant n=1 Tax=Geodermatophilus africanus TaxID=1137993 RepID=A0A1H3N6P9_9ACTN|nr:hypothetical protein [Geodermatophilus africanus]SDY84627.1 hypothetical protein SAMN05660209_03885 [Geodermatophilus africanus]